MSNSSKVSIVAWWIAAVISLLLWYRDHKYDRVIAAIVFTLGLIQLVNYGCHSVIDPVVAGRIIMVLLVSLLLVISVSTYLYTGNKIAMWCGLAVFIALVITVVLLFSTDYLAYVDSTGNCPIWTRSGHHILGSFFWLYILIVVTCWLLLVLHHGYRDISLYIVAAFFVFSAFWAKRISTDNTFGGVWTYLLLGIGLLVWVGGMFSQLDCSQVCK